VADEPQKVERYLRDCARSRQLVLGALTLRVGEVVVSCRTEGAVLQPRTAEQPAVVLLRLLPRQETIHRFLALNERIEALHREVSRRRRAEEDLARQTERLRVTLESIGDAVITADNAGVIEFMNATAEHLTGWRQSEAAGRPLAEVFVILNEETRAPAESPVVRVLRDGVVAGLANHTVLLARDGREIPIDDCAAPIRGRDGRMAGVVLVFHDISERRGLEREITERAERLAESDRRKDEFLSMLSHELRNPLVPIRNALHLLEVPEATPEVKENARLVLRRQLDHLVHLVDDLLDVSRITHGKIQLSRRKLDLVELTVGVADSLAAAFSRRNLVLAVDRDPSPLCVDADPIRLEQVVSNLLHNAIKFTQPGGRVRISARREGGEAVIRVRDTGVGMAPSLLRSIFEPFVQADQSLDRTDGGLGIGLTLVRNLVELHGGTVAAASEGPGRGSEITVRLPLADEPAAELAKPIAEAAVEPASSGGGLRVLVVDDNADAAETVALLLRMWGYEARTANDGAQAFEVAAELDPEVVLLDIGLPGLDGYEVARRLRAGAQGGARLVAMTGYGRDEDRRRALEAGFDEHLVKPVEPATLRAVLARAGDRR
ncbi:MAG TPA: ATP-binding protein, partial [Thermoanaerobaculia bacterium]|nr:ATP-binding protein [Thermoanaerobaculia bacterium]